MKRNFILDFIEVHRQHTNSMKSTLLSTQRLRHMDSCCGIHGVARARKGLKHATITARRRLDKQIIKEEYND